jgi:hypothetical protein
VLFDDEQAAIAKRTAIPTNNNKSFRFMTIPLSFSCADKTPFERARPRVGRRYPRMLRAQISCFRRKSMPGRVATQLAELLDRPRINKKRFAFRVSV